MFSIVVLPDTQHYAVSAEAVAALRSQCRWINDHARQLNIVVALHLGDVVDDYADDAQWIRAQSELGELAVPLVLAAGNHDLIDYPAHQPSVYRGTRQYDRFFPLDHFARLPTFHRAFASSAANSSQLFTADGLELVVVTLEFGPSDDQLSWAKELFTSHPDHLGILVTHDYLGDDDRLRGARTRGAERTRAGFVEEFALPNGDGGTPMGWANTGVEIWEKLVRDCASLRIVLNGHVCTHEARVSAPGGWRTIPGSPYAPSIAGRRTTFRADGSAVYEFLSNYQSMPQGGLGYLRIIEIDPERGQLAVSTYSPYLDRHLDNPDDTFCLGGVDLAGAGKRALLAAPGAGTAQLNELRRLESLGLLAGVPRMVSHPDEPLCSDELRCLAPAVGRLVLGDDLGESGDLLAGPAWEGPRRAPQDRAPATRAEIVRYCAALVRRSGTPGRMTAGYLAAIVDFDDVPPGHDAVDDIRLLRGLGVLGGWPDNTVRLHEPVLRGDAAVLLSRALTACGR